MRSIIASLATIPFILLGTAVTAEASHFRSQTYISSYLPCGTPVYTERYFIGYDRCGTPVWGTRVIRPSYRPACRPVARPVHVAPCPPRRIAPRRCDVPRGGVSVSFQTGWSR